MKAVLISIQPKWCELIASGKKTIEVRKTRPKIETPFKCHIYCSGGIGKQVTWNGNNIELFRWNGVRLIKQKTDAGWVEDRPYQTWHVLLDYGFTHQLHDGDYELNGKVIGSFVCDSIYNIEPHDDGYGINQYTFVGADYDDCKTGLSFEELKEYLGKNIGYAWHISDLKIYDKPKELGEFRKPCVDEYQYCQGCRYGSVILPPDEEEYALYHGGHYENFDTVCRNYVTRPPQSWCYVEQLE